MTELKKKDIIKILTLIRANYDNAYSNTSPEEAEMLINFWYDCLCKYNYETVYAATKNAISHSEFIPRLANIISEAEKLTSAEKKSDEELWAELSASLSKVYEISRYLIYPQHQEWASKKIGEIYNNLDGDLKLYVVNTSSLIEISELNSESLTYERARFFKQMPILKKHSENKLISQNFLNNITSHPQLPEGKK